jgi:Cu2+-exporting ATPase
MMLLIGMALTVAFVASAATTAGFFDLDLWWELVLLVTVMLFGHWLEIRAVGQASGALDALTALLPDTAERVTDDGIETISLDELREGYVVLVRSGGRVFSIGEQALLYISMEETERDGSPERPLSGSSLPCCSVRLPT